MMASNFFGSLVDHGVSWTRGIQAEEEIRRKKISWGQVQEGQPGGDNQWALGDVRAESCREFWNVNKM